MSQRRLPDKETLRRIYIDEGKTAREIADHYGVKQITVYVGLKRYGIRKTEGESWSRERIEPMSKEALETLIKYRLRLEEIAMVAGVSVRLVMKWCSIYHLKIPRPVGIGSTLSEKLLRHLIEHDKLTYKQVADLLDVSPHIVADRAVQLNLKCGTNRGAKRGVPRRKTLA